LKKPLIILTALIAFLAGYPLINEGAGNACSALEKRWYTVSVSASDNSLVESAVIRSLIEAGEGLFAAEYVRKELPEIPPAVTCSYRYWRSFLDEGSLRKIKLSMVYDFPIPSRGRVAFSGETS
jgi:hypothetical protein